MAIRNIVKDGDEILTKKCKPVTKIDKKIITLLDDMAETMAEANGVGLAAPQVGVLKRIAVVNVGEGVIELINPEIINEEGSVIDIEGCLSVPGKWGEVDRPQTVKVRHLNREGEEVITEGEFLLARALCHEIEHLDGHLFLEKVINFVEVEN